MNPSDRQPTGQEPSVEADYQQLREKLTSNFQVWINEGGRVRNLEAFTNVALHELGPWLDQTIAAHVASRVALSNIEAAKTMREMNSAVVAAEARAVAAEKALDDIVKLIDRHGVHSSIIFIRSVALAARTPQPGAAKREEERP